MTLAVICGGKTIAVFYHPYKAKKFMARIACGCRAEIKRIPLQAQRARYSGIKAAKNLDYSPFMRPGHFTL